MSPSSDDLTGGVSALVASHVITPIEILRYEKPIGASTFVIVGGELSGFRKSASSNSLLVGRPVFFKKYRLELLTPPATLTPTSIINSGTTFSFDPKFRLMETFGYNDNLAIITSITPSTGVVRNLEWGHANTLMTSSYVTLASTQFRERFTYNTVYGITSKIDANNLSINYGFDPLGRLSTLKDTQGNLFSHFRYNDRRIQEFTVDFSVSGVQKVGQQVTFVARNSESGGVTRFIWDFGDGTVEETTSSTVSHQYAVARSYTVKLSKVNPEYGTIITSKPVTIIP